jgi:two-component system KDP operon response regulator KdpE
VLLDLLVGGSPGSPDTAYQPGTELPNTEARGLGRILVVAPHARTRQRLETLLTQVGYQVELAGSGEEALGCFGPPPPDAVLLDPALPDVDGLDLCLHIRNQSAVAIICISPASEEARTVEALDRGADDYVTEACSPVELLARLRAAIRRAMPTPPSSLLKSGPLRLDPIRRQVTLSDRPVHLTPTQYKLLHYFMIHGGKVITTPTLLRAVWGEGYEDARGNLRMFIAGLRRKLEVGSGELNYIQTVPRVGYVFSASGPATCPSNPLGAPRPSRPKCR